MHNLSKTDPAWMKPWQGAAAHLNQARQILAHKAHQLAGDGDYQRIRYVKQAARIAYRGVLLALDAYLPQEALTLEKPCSEIDGYRTRLSKERIALIPVLN